MWYKNPTTIKLKDNISHDSKILLVIAHPDDEAMFFGPLLIASRKELSQISILCLSNGNYDGLGKIRSKELLESGNIFSIPNDKITIIENNRLQDGMNNNWPVDIIADIVIEHSIGINTVMDYYYY
jgi:N-acetylglucosaminylphosphatidylinositol deacetylase